MRASRVGFWVGGVLVIAACTVGGYAFGHTKAASKADAHRERQEAFEQAFAGAKEHAESASRAKGQQTGLVSGRRAGEDAGAADGKSAAEAKLAAAAAAQNGGCPAGEVPVQIQGGPPCSPPNPPSGCIPGTGPGQANPQCEAPPGSPAYHGPGGAY
jgi:hypothetical protein